MLHDVALADAGATAGGVALITLGLGAGGALGARLAGHVVGAGEPLTGKLGPCLVFGAWTVVLFMLLLAGARMAGATALGVLGAGFGVLIWGAVAGIGVVDPTGEREYGRALVGSCVGVTGAILGVYLTASPVWQSIALPVLAPPEASRGWDAGDLFLVRRTADAPAGAIVLLKDARTGHELLAVRGAEGEHRPIVDPAGVYETGAWTVAGRIFLHFGKNGAQTVPPR